MTIEKLVDVDGTLIRRAEQSMRRREKSDKEIPTREVFTDVVATWIPVVVAMIKEAGLVHDATGKRRPRRFDEGTWDLIEAAEKEVDVSRVALLRCCLQLQVEHGDRIQQFIRTLSSRVRESEKQIRGKIQPSESS